MKKSKFLTCLSAAFITAFALMSCNNVVQGRGHVVLSIDGVEYTAEELFNDQKSPEAAEAKFNGVYKALIRNYFANTTEGQSLKDEVKRETDIKISSKKAEAKSNAKKNGTSYDTEWDKILNDNNCDSTNELYDKFEYDVQKQKFDDKFYDRTFEEDGKTKTNFDVLRDGGWLGGKEIIEEGKDPNLYKVKGYLKNRFPYHIKHILVKLSGVGKDNVTATISADEADHISRIVRRLARGDDFDTVAYDESDDGSGKSAGGSVGIMSKETSFVHEMQFGTYLYDAFYNDETSGIWENVGQGETGTNDNLYYQYPGLDEKGCKEERENTSAPKLLFDNDFVKGAGYYANQLTELKDPTSFNGVNSYSGIGQIPLEAALALGEDSYQYDDDKNTHDGLAKLDFDSKRKIFEDLEIHDDINAKYFPRNVIFNKYFNKHNIMVITPNDCPMVNLDISGIYGTYVNKKSIGSGTERIGHDEYLGTLNTYYSSLDGFNQNPKDEDILRGGKQGDTRDVNLYHHIEGQTDLANDKNVLRDNEGRTILVIRAGTSSNSSNDDSGYEGIHFFVIERSPFINLEFDKDEDIGELNTTTDGKFIGHVTDLNEYYSQYYPNKNESDNKHHPYYIEEDGSLGNPKKTFAHYLNRSENEEKQRADLVRKELTNTASTANTNPNLNLYTFKYLEKGITFKGEIGESIKSQIDDWLEVKLDTRSEDKKWENDWKKYHDTLNAQARKREERETQDGKISSNLISEACAAAFIKTKIYGDDQKIGDLTYNQILKLMFDKGGVFHD